jgi:hypothetical protein
MITCLFGGEQAECGEEVECMKRELNIATTSRETYNHLQPCHGKVAKAVNRGLTKGRVEGPGRICPFFFSILPYRKKTSPVELTDSRYSHHTYQKWQSLKPVRQACIELRELDGPLRS